MRHIDPSCAVHHIILTQKFSIEEMKFLIDAYPEKLCKSCTHVFLSRIEEDTLRRFAHGEKIEGEAEGEKDR